MAQKVGQLFEKHVIKSVQQIQNIPTGVMTRLSLVPWADNGSCGVGCIPIGLEDTFPWYWIPIRLHLAF